MHWHFENWNDMKHELWKFWLVKTIFLIYAKLVPYSLTPPYRHLYNMDTSLLWTVCLVPEMPKIIHSLPL